MCKTIELRRTGLYNNVPSVTSTHYEDRPLTKQTCTSQREYNGVPTFCTKIFAIFIHYVMCIHVYVHVM